jgi:RNA recognition motif-containing protein
MASIIQKVVGLVYNPEDKMAEETETKQEEKKTENLSEEDIKAVKDVKGRLEFFFSDANIRQDRFIRNLLMDKEGDQKVPIESLLRFNTIKRYTEKIAVLVAAAKELSSFLTLDESETAIGRAVEFTESMMDDNIPKSLFIKNLPVRENDQGRKVYGVTVDEIKELFKKYGAVVLVKMIWGGNRKNKQPFGCAMVEFKDKESQEKAAAAALTLKEGSEVEARETLEIGGSKLTVMLLSEHVSTRKKEKEAREKTKSGKKRDRSGDEKEIREFTCEWQPGCVIKVAGLPEGCDREAILDAVAFQLNISVEEVKGRKVYADFSKGQTEGAIRFREPADVKEMADQLKNGELKVRGEKVKDAFILEGDIEKKYYDDFIAFKNKQIRHHEETKRARKKGRFHRGRRN